MLGKRKSRDSLKKSSTASRDYKVSTDKNTKTPSDVSSSEADEEFEVDYIEGHKISKDGEKIEFFVRWKNYKSDDNTWEPFDFFAYDAPELA